MPNQGKQNELETVLDRESSRKKGEIKEEYVHKECSGAELKSPRPTASMKKTGNRDVRPAIEQVKGSAVYDTADRVRSSRDEAERTVKLHGSLGRKYAKEGNYVLEISIAGSGFTEFRKMEHNSTGKQTFTADPVKNIKTARIKFAKNPTLDNSDFEAAVSFSNNVNVETMLNTVYGERYADPEGKMSEYIRVKKTSEGIQKVFIPGPGELDSSDSKRSMDSARHNALFFAREYLTDRFETFKKDPDKIAPINIMIQGHSRGGVAAGESLQMIEHWVNANYPQYKDCVNFNLIQYDPVPGTGSYGNHKVLDFTAKGKISDGLNNADRSNSADPSHVETTVMYSMKSTEDTFHRWFFDPQKVIGAKRVIISPECHSLMLGTADDTQKTGLAKIGFTLAETGEVYRGSGLNELPEGVYVCDESHTLIRCDSPEEVRDIMMRVAGRSVGQHKRFDTVVEAAADCIGRTKKAEKIASERPAQLIPDDDAPDAGEGDIPDVSEPEAAAVPGKELPESDEPEKEKSTGDAEPVRDNNDEELSDSLPEVTEKPKKPAFYKFWFRKIVDRYDRECRNYELENASYKAYLGRQKAVPAAELPHLSEEERAGRIDIIAENLYKGAVFTIKSRDKSEIYQETVEKNYNDPEKKSAWLEGIKQSETFRMFVEGRTDAELTKMVNDPVGTYVEYGKLEAPVRKEGNSDSADIVRTAVKSGPDAGNAPAMTMDRH